MALLVLIISAVIVSTAGYITINQLASKIKKKFFFLLLDTPFFEEADFLGLEVG